MSRTQKQISEAITGLVASRVPELVAAGLDRMATRQSDPFARGVLDIMSAFVEDNGPGAIVALADDLQKMIDGDPLAAMRIKADTRYETARLLSEFVDHLQSAEAADRRNAKRLLDALAVVLADIGTVIARALVTAL